MESTGLRTHFGLVVFIVNLVRYMLWSNTQAKYTQSFERVRSDYVWMRWATRADDAEPPNRCKLLWFVEGILHVDEMFAVCQ